MESPGGRVIFLDIPGHKKHGTFIQNITINRAIFINLLSHARNFILSKEDYTESIVGYLWHIFCARKSKLHLKTKRNNWAVKENAYMKALVTVYTQKHGQYIHLNNFKWGWLQ